MDISQAAGREAQFKRFGTAAFKLSSGAALPLLSILGAWYLLVYLSGLPEFVIPKPHKVLATLFYEREYLGYHLWETLKASAVGYVFANILGISLAALFIVLPSSRRVALPLAVTLRNVPYVALITILVLALGDGFLPKVLIVTLAVFFPIMVNVHRGLLSVDPLILDRMRILDAGALSTFLRVRIPSSLPFFVAAQEVAGSSAVITTIAAEWMMSSSGLGYIINRAMALYRGDEVYAVAFLAAVISYAIYVLVGWLGRQLDWQSPSR
jgi:ABC-type nitrate/sulfonate/bicarbonate transport system permease component